MMMVQLLLLSSSSSSSSRSSSSSSGGKRERVELWGVKLAPRRDRTLRVSDHSLVRHSFKCAGTSKLCLFFWRWPPKLQSTDHDRRFEKCERGGMSGRTRARPRWSTGGVWDEKREQTQVWAFERERQNESSRGRRGRGEIMSDWQSEFFSFIRVLKKKCWNTLNSCLPRPRSISLKFAFSLLHIAVFAVVQNLFENLTFSWSIFRLRGKPG